MSKRFVIGKPVDKLPERKHGGKKPESAVSIVAAALAACTNGQWLPIRAKNVMALRGTLGATAKRCKGSPLYGCEVVMRGRSVYIRRAQ